MPILHSLRTRNWLVFFNVFKTMPTPFTHVYASLFTTASSSGGVNAPIDELEKEHRHLGLRERVALRSSTALDFQQPLIYIIGFTESTN